MQILRYSVLALIAVSWIQLFTHQGSAPKPGIHPDVKPHVDRFIELGKQHRGADFTIPNINIDIGKANDLTDQFLLSNVLGWCKPWFSPREILLDEEYWQSAGTLDREQLVFHELGHCALDREHNETWARDDWPTSIMYPSNEIDQHKYAAWYDYYIKELFTGKK